MTAAPMASSDARKARDARAVHMADLLPVVTGNPPPRIPGCENMSTSRCPGAPSRCLGFLRRLSVRSHHRLPVRLLRQVLAPALIALRGMSEDSEVEDREGLAGSAREAHAGLLRRLAPLPQVTGPAGAHHVLPHAAPSEGF